MDCVINTLPLHNNVHNLVPNSTIIIQTVWSDESIVIALFLCNEKKGFRGTLLKSKLTNAANELELNVDEFMAETKKALCSENGLPDFTYVLEQAETSKIFKWCKSTQGFRIIYGDVVLDDHPELVEEILLDSIRINRSKDQQIEMLNANIRRMDNSFNEMQLLLEKCVAEKNHIENELLAKFSALLNTKKKKITELEGIIKNRSMEADDFESDGTGDDSDLDYSSQMYIREKIPVPSTSIDPVVVVPKRSKNKPTTNEPFVHVEETKPSTTESMDIYDRETEVLLDDM